MSSQKEKRDIPSEIKQLRSRKEFDTYWQISKTFKQISNILKDLKKRDTDSNKELLKYIPVNLVGSMESFLRSTIAKLINHGGIYMDNSKNLTESNSIRFDFDAIRNINKREFTIGEFLAHQLSFSNCNQINQTFSKLLGADFTKTLNEFDASIHFENPFNNNKIKNFNQVSVHVFANLNRLFELRHIICHEMAVSLELDIKEITVLVASTRIFIYQIYYYTYLIMFPDNLEDEEILAERAESAFQKAEKDLEDYLLFIKNNPKSSMECNVDYDLFIKSHEYWKNYRKQYLQALCANLKVDPLNTMFYEQAKEMTIDRLDDLKFEFENIISTTE